MKSWPFTCEVCNKGFLDRRDMLDHLKTHDESRKSMARFLPEDMVEILDTEGSVMFDGRVVKAGTVCPVCFKIFDKPYIKKKEVKRR